MDLFEDKFFLETSRPKIKVSTAAFRRQSYSLTDDLDCDNISSTIENKSQATLDPTRSDFDRLQPDAQQMENSEQKLDHQDFQVDDTKNSSQKPTIAPKPNFKKNASESSKPNIKPFNNLLGFQPEKCVESSLQSFSSRQISSGEIIADTVEQNSFVPKERSALTPADPESSDNAKEMVIKTECLNTCTETIHSLKMFSSEPVSEVPVSERQNDFIFKKDQSIIHDEEAYSRPQIRVSSNQLRNQMSSNSTLFCEENVSPRPQIKITTSQLESQKSKDLVPVTLEKRSSDQSTNKISTEYFHVGTSINTVLERIMTLHSSTTGVWLLNFKVKDPENYTDVENKCYVRIKDSKHCLQTDKEYVALHYSGANIL